MEAGKKQGRFWILIICLLALFAANKHNYKGDRYQRLIKADGKGYYAYLPAIFIYGDLNFGHFEPIEIEDYPETEIYDYRYKLDRQRIYNKYYAGTSVMMAPFFLATHGLSKAMGWTSDGYANHYHVGISIAAIFYLGFGLFFMGKVLTSFGVSYRARIVIYFLATFGTNWFYYVVNEPAVSHIYTAALLPFMVWLFIRFIKEGGIKLAIGIGLSLGLICLIRPINGMLVFAIPMFFYFPSSFLHFVKKKLWNRNLVIMLLCFIAVVSVQFIIYKIQLDQWYIYSYVGEHINLLKPNVGKFLLSYKKGMFLYSPVLVLSILGCAIWFKKNSFQALYCFGFISLVVYVLSSWHMWWYGGGFSCRVMIDYYLFWMIPIGLLLTHAKGYLKTISYTIAVVLTLYSFVLSMQYLHGMIHWELMDKTKYWAVFLKPWFGF